MKRFAPATWLSLAIISAALFSGCAPEASENGNVAARGQNGSKEKSSENQTDPNSSADDTANSPTSADERKAGDQTETENQPPEKNGDKPAQPAEPVIVNDPAFHDSLTAAADDYLGFVMVNATALTAPTDCRAAVDDAQPLMSQSDDEATHGEKMYFLFAKEITHYLGQDGTPAPEGQVLVKESWTSKPSNPNARNLRTHASGVRVNPRAIVGDKTLEIGKRKQLFVMLKLAAETPGTDHGWVYGVVDPETKVVSESGKVNSCIECHRDAKHDRMFGPADFSF